MPTDSPRRRVNRSCLAFLIAGLLEFSGTAVKNQESSQTAPRLVVLLVVDQMRAEYVERFERDWTAGLRRVVDDGAVYTNAAYPYMNTFTCAGHATIATGVFPAVHGMVLNAWWDRELGRNVTCIDDPKHPLVSYGAPTKSAGGGPWRLRAPTFADELRAQARTAPRVVTLSLKGRSAVPLAGQRADAVTWFDEIAHTWITSSAYSERPVPFVADFLGREPLSQSLNDVWTKLLSPDRYLSADDAAGEDPPTGWSRTFPHPFDDGTHAVNRGFYERWQASPASDAYLARLAQAAVLALNLGRGPGVDYLGVGFSALDFVGHDFGPQSQEVQDVLAHLDRTIGSLLAFLDERVGRERYLVALTADHGVSEIPEQAARDGRDAGRIVIADVVARVEQALRPILGESPHVGRMNFTDLYFLPRRAADILNNPATLEAARQAALSVPGVLRVASSLDLSRPADDPWLAAVRLGFFPGRSGDLIVIPKPNWILVNAPAKMPPVPAATHGTAHAYDQRVPLVLMGAAIKPGKYVQVVTPADIAPTLASLTGVTMPRAQGRVLREALKTDTFIGW